MLCLPLRRHESTAAQYRQDVQTQAKPSYQTDRQTQALQMDVVNNSQSAQPTNDPKNCGGQPMVNIVNILQCTNRAHRIIPLPRASRSDPRIHSHAKALIVNGEKKEACKTDDGRRSVAAANGRVDGLTLQ